jgi:hypothetical protein
MAKPCNQPLKTNPFTTNRDPHTGKWMVNHLTQQHNQSNSIATVKAV